MAVNSKTKLFDDLASTTMEKIRPKIADAIFEESPFLKWMMQQGRVDTTTGGTHIETRVMYQKNETVAAYSHYDKLNTTPTESLTAAHYSWRQYAGAITISGREEAINSGEEQIIDLLAHQADLLEMSFKDKIAEKMLALTSTKDMSKDILGLEEIIENVAGGSQGTLGGINKTTYSWWRNQRDAISDYDTAAGSDSKLLYTKWTNMLNNCQRQKFVSRGDFLILTTQAVVEKFEKENRDDVRYVTDRNALDLGWTEFKFKGVPVAWDDRVYYNSSTPDNDHRVFFIAAPHLKFLVHKNRNFAMTPFRTPVDQDAKVAFMLLMCQLVSNNNRNHGVLEIDNMN